MLALVLCILMLSIAHPMMAFESHFVAVVLQHLRAHPRSRLSAADPEATSRASYTLSFNKLYDCLFGMIFLNLKAGTEIFGDSRIDLEFAEVFEAWLYSLSTGALALFLGSVSKSVQGAVALSPALFFPQVRKVRSLPAHSAQQAGIR